MAKPKVSDQTWQRIYHNPIVEVFMSKEDDMFFKVTTKNKRPKYFYGETAHSDFQRYAYDETMSATK